MIARMGSGWQTVLTDLSLILFMITAAVLEKSPMDNPPGMPKSANLPALAAPVAVWRQGGASLNDWLQPYRSDPHLHLTVVAGRDAAPAALALAQSAPLPARVVIEPDAQGEPYAALTYDRADDVARDLLVNTPKP